MKRVTKTTAEKKQEAWRNVAYIGMQRGARGGYTWRLVLDTSGHTEYRKATPPRWSLRAIQQFLAPERVICTACTFGHAHLDVGQSIELARRLASTLIGKDQ